jgi:ABC-2 type transport system permease protein
MLLQLLQIELYKIFKRPRTYISFVAITAIVVIIQVGLKYDGKAYLDLLLEDLSDVFDISDDQKTNLLNGYFICYFILNTLLLQVPILVALIAGDALAGEANMGTLRLILSKPVTRVQLVLAKFLAAMLYVILLLVWMALLALALSVLLFGTNDLYVFRETTIHISAADDVLWRYIAAFAYAAVALTVVASLALLLSTFADNAIGPIIATVSIVLILTILSQLNIPLYDNTVKPWLFTTHMVGWKGFFYVQSTPEGETIKGSIENLPGIMRSLGILGAYILLFLGSTLVLFGRKDILS